MLSLETVIARLLLALLIGGIVGIEREYRNKSAGFRTLTLICVGSCLFTLVSILLSNGTTDRIASNVVTGIGFIGAGVIFKSEKGVNGLTTAASIWVTAALGMAIASGLYIASAVATAIVLVVLSILTIVEEIVDKIHQERMYKIVTVYQPDILTRYERIMFEKRLKFSRVKLSRLSDEITGYWKVRGSQKNHEHFIEAMLKDDSIKEFDF